MFHPPCLSAVRTLHPLVLPARVSDPLPGDRLRRGLYVGAQTTGFDPRSDAVIELGLLPFTYTVGGRIVDVFHDAAQVHRNDPQRAVTPPIVAFTGQTGADLRGASVDVPAATALIVAADLIVAHDAEFARPFVERVLPVAREVAWACSQREVPWAKAGFLSVALHCLACAFGVYAPDPDRVVTRCAVGVWLLASALPRTGQPVLAALRERALVETVRLWALCAPFEARGVLEARGYRWMPEDHQEIRASWWTDVVLERQDEEIDWLTKHAYEAFGAVAPPPDAFPRRPMTALDRWRYDPPEVRPPAGGGTLCRRSLH